MSQVVKVKIKDRWYTVEVEDLTANPVCVLVDGEPVEVNLEDLMASPAAPEQAGASDEQQAGRPAPLSVAYVVRTPMPGVIMSVSVREGDEVSAGDEVCILEAMKMQQSLKADAAGRVLKIHVHQGQQVQSGAVVADIG
jgi:biotin carboxyl carrier protein